MTQYVVISGTVRGNAGAPVEGARVFLTDGPGPFPDLAALTDDAGRFVLSVPMPGGYVLECHAEGFAPTSMSVTAEAIEPVSVEVRLQSASGTA